MPKPSPSSRSHLNSALFGSLSGRSDQISLARAIEIDDPALAEAALNGRSPFQRMEIEGLSYPQAVLRQETLLSWALRTPAPRVAEFLIQRAGADLSASPDPVRELDWMRVHEREAAIRGDLHACQLMTASGWPAPPMMIAAEILLVLLRSRGKRHAPQTIRPRDPNAPKSAKLTQAAALEPTVEWVIQNGADPSVPLGQLPREGLFSCVNQSRASLTLLMIAGSGRVAKALIERGADMSMVDRNGCSALGHAMSQGQRGWIEELARAGAPLDACVGSLHVGEAALNLRRPITGEWALDAARDALEQAAPASSVSPAANARPKARL